MGKKEIRGGEKKKLTPQGEGLRQKKRGYLKKAGGRIEFF